ncbi:MAG: right-handed parallel beta-helix repeat-containing protein [Candidatus Heimdallarchaeota archaeon]|nr:right-handed parallel beta-helix repeat-containing protein [Candidatus Heimdallarchaeota archaeon]MBY8993464.1 right-handed parallel beta-helix repeat-containing protein [Candidatus Heimdallarchaeota archaeon]
MKTKGFIIGIIFCSIFVTNCCLNSTLLVSDNFSINKENPSNSIINSLSHGPINIDSEDDILTYGLPGSGTREDPYRIENLSIIEPATYAAISISDMFEVHFVVQNCEVVARDYGIIFHNSIKSSVDIVNNSISDCLSYGITISECENFIITNNTFVDCSEGINTYLCKFVEISNNHFTNSLSVTYYDCSIGMFDCRFIKIANNTCSGWSTNFRLFYTSHIQIYNNTCYAIQNNAAVFDFIEVWQSKIVNNLITCQQTEFGIRLEDSSYNEICFNEINNCSSFGIYIKSPSCTQNIIHQNNFLNNNDNSSQASDQSLTNVWYNSQINKGNYWSDWSGIGSYIINNVSDVNDPYPLATKAEINWTEFSLSDFPEDDYLEENDDFDYAKTISLDTWYDLTCLDDDYFIVEAHRFYHLNITILTASEDHIIGASIYASNEAVLKHEWNLAVRGEVNIKCPYTGNYFIGIWEIYHYQLITNYSLIVTTYPGEIEDDLYEENDIFEEAISLNLLNSTYDLIYADFDYFKISVEEGTNFKIEIVFDNTYIDLDLYILPNDFSGDPSDILVKSESQTSMESVTYSTNDAGGFIILIQNTQIDGIAQFPTNYTLTLTARRITLQFSAISPLISLVLLIIPIIIRRRK